MDDSIQALSNCFFFIPNFRRSRASLGIQRKYFTLHDMKMMYRPFNQHATEGQLQKNYKIKLVASICNLPDPPHRDL